MTIDKIIIAGGRDIELTAQQISDLMFGLNIPVHFGTEIVNGMCPAGIDRAAREWARYESLDITEFPANWELHGKAAGPIRNRAMAEYADALVLIWDGQSKGSRSMLNEAKKAGLKVYQIVME